ASGQGEAASEPLLVVRAMVLQSENRRYNARNLSPILHKLVSNKTTRLFVNNLNENAGLGSSRP
ncbi:hypothetical protein, partial [Dickeya dianthicola]|uniref:hypothetical protein n=1 Tax=Dickeya dianthicola TaxID=204039 RepID=UPI001E32538E